MWKNDRSAEAPGRLENLKELIRSMEEYESLRSFLEHVALVMDAEQNAELDAVSIMTLHSAKGLEFETVFLPGWEEGLFPHQRALDEGGRSGLEEERRLAYVGLTRAKKNLHIWFVSNRRIHGLWQSTIPSRFLDELPEAHVEVADAGNSYGGYGGSSLRARARGGRQNPYGASRFDNLGADRRRLLLQHLRHARLAARAGQPDRGDRPQLGHALRPRRSSASAMARPIPASAPAAPRSRRAPSTANWSPNPSPTRPRPSRVGDRVFHQKFGNGNVSAIDGNKLTIDFDRAGQKRVLDGFVTGV